MLPRRYQSPRLQPPLLQRAHVAIGGFGHLDAGSDRERDRFALTVAAGARGRCMGADRSPPRGRVGAGPTAARERLTSGRHSIFGEPSAAPRATPPQPKPGRNLRNRLPFRAPHRGNEETVMNMLASLPAFSAYAVSVVVLGLNLVGLANATAITRAKATEVINPEDLKLNQKAAVVYDGGNDRTARYRRAHRNALENTPVFMITALVLMLMGTSATIGAALFYPYAALRILHSVFYVKGVQPLRTLVFVLALLIQVAVLGLIGYNTFAG
jgi:uncharacterized MAPEG superfamily protein